MAGNLTQKDMQDLMKEGYSIREINEAVREVEQEELKKSYNQTRQQVDPRTFSQTSAFMTDGQDNLIKWQLELDNILGRAEHILRGDILVHEGGHLIWKKQTNTSNQILNEYGVQEVMRVLSMYLNRNTILSDYDDNEVKQKILDFGREINDLFFMKYEEFGLNVNFEETFNKLFEVKAKVKREVDGTYYVYMLGEKGETVTIELTPEQIAVVKLYQEKYSLEKRKNYPMLLREMVDIVHSAYARAKDGGERRSLREARQVTQTEPIYPMGMGGQGLTINNMGQTRQRGVLNPMRYIMGKYK